MSNPTGYLGLFGVYDTSRPGGESHVYGLFYGFGVKSAMVSMWWVWG